MQAAIESVDANKNGKLERLVGERWGEHQNKSPVSLPAKHAQDGLGIQGPDRPHRTEIV